MFGFAKASSLSGNGEQMRVLAAICAEWDQKSKPPSHVAGAGASPNLTDYNFTITDEGAVYRVQLTPKKPAVKKIVTSRGTVLENESTIFHYDVRRIDFKVVSVAAVL